MKIQGVTGTRNDGKLTTSQQNALNRRQAKNVRCVNEYWESKKKKDPHPEIAMPTGFGKGRVVHRLLKSSKHDQILLNVGTKNLLLDQSHDALAELALSEAGDADFSVLPDLSGRVVLATWQGLTAFARKLGKPPTFGLAVIDEAHNTGTPKRLELLNWLKPDHVAGLTATAHRANGKMQAPEQYGFTIVDSMPLPECINKQWLSPLVGISIDTEVMLPASARVGNGLNQRKVSRALRKHPHLFNEIANDIATRFLSTGMKTVIVVNRVHEEACIIAQELERRGFTVGLAVNQRAAKELSDRFITLDAIERYKLPHGHPDSIQVLISPQVIGEGFDAPATECVIWAAPTLSHVRYTQVIGRGSRRCWKKKYCLVVDYVYSIENYGYSYNFAQFFQKKDIQELEGGYMYVGPDKIGSKIRLPNQYSQGGRVVSIVDLRIPIVPPAGLWLSSAEIAKSISLTSATTNKILNKEFSHLAQTRKNRESGQNTPHYPPEVRDELLQRRHSQLNHPPAGKWLTLNQIVASIPNKGRIWAEARIKDHFPGVGETRLDQHGRTFLHYPPRVLKKLKKLAGSTKNAGNWMTAFAMSKKLEKSQPWIEEEISKHFSHLGEERDNGSGHKYMCYPPSVLSQLQDLANTVQPAKSWLTEAAIAEAVGKSRRWVKNRLERHFADESEDRLDSYNRVRKHWPPRIVKELRSMK